MLVRNQTSTTTRSVQSPTQQDRTGVAPVSMRGLWIPAVDVYEDENQYVLQVDLPGLSDEDIELHLENRVLTMRGERKMLKGLDLNNFHKIERDYGRFVRSFTLPMSVEQDKIQANLREGVLTLTLPKAESVKPRRIEIGA